MTIAQWTLAAAALAVSGTAAAQQLAVTDLGTIGGDAAGGDAINAAGQVVGWSKDDPWAYYGFRSSPSGVPLTTLLPPAGGDASYALGIDDLGRVVGFAEVPIGFGEGDHAVLWDGGPIDLGTLGGDESQAHGINASRQVVGWAHDAAGGTQAFWWEAGVMSLLPGYVGGYPDSIARAVNGAGVAVGQAYDASGVRQAVRWEGGALTAALDLPPSSSGATAYDINEAGEVVGNSWGGGTTALLWAADNSVTELPSLRGLSYNIAKGINDAGQIVGTSYGTTTADHIVWDHGVAFDVDDLVADMTGYFGFVLSDVNDAGQISALASVSGGSVAVRLDPVPGSLGLSGPYPARAGQDNRLALRGATPGSTVVFGYGAMAGTTPIPGCPGLFADFSGGVVAGTVTADASGIAVLDALAPASAAGKSAWFQAYEVGTCKLSNTTLRSF